MQNIDTKMSTSDTKSINNPTDFADDLDTEPPVNEHISNYLLDHYFELSTPYYAVMLSGEWGCGKTWFINQVMNTYAKQKRRQELSRLDRYLSLSTSHYSVVLSGEWGCGKTWFINDIMYTYAKQKIENRLETEKEIEKKLETEKEIEKKLEQKKKKLFMYISLYGMKDIAEIDAAIFQKTHPILASEPIAFAGSLLGSFSKFGLNLNLDFNNNRKLKKILKTFKSNKNRIMVFDDLERCHIPHQELFGYINKFVEHRGQKVILLSHEDELFKKKNETEEDTKRYKEKIIGATFNVRSTVKNVYKEFIKLKPVDAKTKKLLSISKHEDIVLSVYNKIGKNNLRDLRQAIVSFSYFLEQFPDEMIKILESRQQSFWGHYNKNNEFEHIIKFYFFLLLEEKGGSINKTNWDEAASIFGSEKISYSEFLKKPEEQQDKIRKNLQWLALDGLFDKEVNFSEFQKKTKEQQDKIKKRFTSIACDGLFGADWYDVVILNKVILDKDKNNHKHYSPRLNSIFENIKKSERTRSKAVSVLREELEDLSNPVFEEKYNELLHDIQNDEVDDVFELFYSFEMLLFLHKNKTTPKEKGIDFIKEQIGKNLKRNLENKKFDVMENPFHSENWNGARFYEHESKEIQNMITYFKQIQSKEKDDKLMNELQELISNLEKNWKTIRDEIEQLSEHNKFSHMPFLSYIKDKENFFNSVFSLPVRKMRNLMDSLFRRYTVNRSDKFEDQRMPEQSFIEDFIKHIEDKKTGLSPMFNSAIIKCNLLLNYLTDIRDVLISENRKIENRRKYPHSQRAAAFTDPQPEPIERTPQQEVDRLIRAKKFKELKKKVTLRQRKL